MKYGRVDALGKTLTSCELKFESFVYITQVYLYKFYSLILRITMVIRDQYFVKYFWQEKWQSFNHFRFNLLIRSVPYKGHYHIAYEQMLTHHENVYVQKKPQVCT